MPQRRFRLMFYIISFCENTFYISHNSVRSILDVTSVTRQSPHDLRFDRFGRMCFDRCSTHLRWVKSKIFTNSTMLASLWHKLSNQISQPICLYSDVHYTINLIRFTVLLSRKVVRQRRRHLGLGINTSEWKAFTFPNWFYSFTIQVVVFRTKTFVSSYNSTYNLDSMTWNVIHCHKKLWKLLLVQHWFGLKLNIC